MSHQGRLRVLIAVAGTCALVSSGIAREATAEKPVRGVSLVIGCIQLPEGGKVVLTRNLRDAWMGYAQRSPGAPRIAWATGMVESRLTVSDERKLVWTKKLVLGGRTFDCGAIEERGKRSLIVRIEMAEFSLVSSVDADLHDVLAIAELYRTDLPSDSCARAEIQGGQAF